MLLRIRRLITLRYPIKHAERLLGTTHRIIGREGKVTTVVLRGANPAPHVAHSSTVRQPVQLGLLRLRLDQDVCESARVGR
jgi:hypothetical protein